MQIPSATLRIALRNREIYEDRLAENASTFRYNVLDLTLSQIIKHAWDNELIERLDYINR